MGLARFGLRLAAGVSALAFAGSLIHCAKDPNEGKAVAVADPNCPDLNVLANEPSAEKPKAHATLRAFIEVAEELRTKANDVEGRLKALCSEADADLGLPPGENVVAACQALSRRMEETIKKGPVVNGPPIQPYPVVQLQFPSFCKEDSNAKAACLAKCAPNPCDNTKCADPAQLAGVCDGDCTGTCSTSGVDVACFGKCEGTCSGLDKGDCTGECVGECTAPSFNSTCESGCSAGVVGFDGECKGGCAGVCDGVAVGKLPTTPTLDGGAEAGAAEGVPCGGKCTGYCSANASGRCAGPCTGKFHGYCDLSNGGACTGSCNAGKLGTPCTTTCTGTCSRAVPPGEKCAGTCSGGCSVPLRDATCTGRLECGQDVECQNACEAKARSSVTCTPGENFHLFAINDQALYATLRKFGGRLGAIAQEIEALKDAQAFIAERTAGDFSAVGATNDVARACVARGIKANAEALEKIRSLVLAEPTTRKYNL